MSSPTPETSLRNPGTPWRRWARLVRLPAVFTVVAQVWAAFLLASDTLQPYLAFALVLSSAICLYWFGMILNDVWDFEEDQRERANRPLPNGEIGRERAAQVAWGLMGMGLLLAGASGGVTAADSKYNLMPLGVAVLIAICIVLYNGPLKPTVVAPVLMGLCRMLCFVLGASPVLHVDSLADLGSESMLQSTIGIAGLGMGVYIMGVTVISKGETVGGRALPIAMGTLVIALGAVCMALAPQTSTAKESFTHFPVERFPWLIGLIVCSVLLRCIRVIANPDAMAIQSLVRASILSLIPLCAAFALLAAGPIWALAVFALAIPALWSAKLIRVT